MPDQVISPIIPHPITPRAASAHRTTRPLPLADHPVIDTQGVVYGMGRLDSSGRIADHTITTALGWRPGDRLVINPQTHLITLHRDPTGLFTMAARGYLPLPAAARCRLGIQPGDRLLLAATPGHRPPGDLPGDHPAPGHHGLSHREGPA